MEVPEALKALESDSQRERLEAARSLARSATPEILPQLRRALGNERLPWIRSALETGVARASVRIESSAEDHDIVPLTDDHELASEIYASATEDLTDRFVHELRPLLGLARLAAAREIEDYDASETATVLSQMQDLLRAIVTLGRAAAAPRVSEFSLPDLLREIAATSDATFDIDPEDDRRTRLEGPDPLIAVSDPDLIALAVRNGVRNALEASTLSNEPVVVTWGHTHSELWIAVLNKGEPLTVDTTKAMAPGASTKEHHPGMGLAIAGQAASSLGGSIDLEPIDAGFTRFQLTWPKGAHR